MLGRVTWFATGIAANPLKVLALTTKLRCCENIALIMGAPTSASGSRHWVDGRASLAPPPWSCVGMIDQVGSCWFGYSRSNTSELYQLYAACLLQINRACQWLADGAVNSAGRLYSSNEKMAWSTDHIDLDCAVVCQQLAGLSKHTALSLTSLGGQLCLCKPVTKCIDAEVAVMLPICCGW